jgi:hypothetical protein
MCVFLNVKRESSISKRVGSSRSLFVLLIFVTLSFEAATFGDFFVPGSTLITDVLNHESPTYYQNPTAVAKAIDTFAHSSTEESVRASNLVDVRDWKATPETRYEVCFVTSVFSWSAESSDRPPDVRQIRDANPTFAFWAFTSMSDLDAPGWTIKTKTFEYKRYITQSRWAKFMGWSDDDVRSCQAVFYMDGFCGPKLKHADRYKRMAKAIHESEFGLFQNLHEAAKGPLDELDRIVQRNKDIVKNVEASKAWLMAQPDFRTDLPMYANHYIGYDPKNIKFQKAAQFFWDRYSLELDSWRDQPLWSYVLDHFHIKPVRLGTFEALFKEYYKRMGHGGHRYDAKADSDAVKR